MSTSPPSHDIFNNKWIHTFTPYTPSHSSFLLCFHHAGSNYTNFNTWQKRMPHVLILAICLPGRMKRANEKLVMSVQEVSKLIVGEFFRKPAIQKLFTQSTVAFFGHSLGSLLVYDICIELTNNNLVLPNYIFNCCSAPPNYRIGRYMEASAENLDYDDEKIDLEKVYFTHKLADKQFVQVLKNMGGTPNEILNSPEMLEYFLPIIKADFKMVELYNGTNNIVLPNNVKIYIFNGSDDKSCTDEISNGWRLIATDPDSVSIITFKGGHFLVQESTEVQDYIGKILTKSNQFFCW